MRIFFLFLNGSITKYQIYIWNLKQQKMYIYIVYIYSWERTVDSTCNCREDRTKLSLFCDYFVRCSRRFRSVPPAIRKNRLNLQNFLKSKRLRELHEFWHILNFVDFLWFSITYKKKTFFWPIKKTSVLNVFFLKL